MTFVAMPLQSTAPKHFALFRLGFRPFFLFAALLGAVLIGLWSLVFAGVAIEHPLHGLRWHGHEMLFGYTVAVIAGFLLTAVKNWTGHPMPAGASLVALFTLWLAGRVLPWLPVPPLLSGLVDMAFIPALIAALTPALLHAPVRNRAFLIMLGLLGIANGLSNAEALGWLNGARMVGFYLALNMILLMIVVIGGRVIPFFTERPLGITIVRHPWFDKTAIAVTVLLLITQLAFPRSLVANLMIWVNIAVHGARLWHWYDHGIWKHPLVWILHVAYAWLILGFLLVGSAPWLHFNPIASMHALTVGCLLSITLGMMARVSLGHTGRPLKLSGIITAAFVLLQLAALIRVFAVLIWPSHYLLWMQLSGWMIVASFAAFVLVYTPILVKPRPDGHDG